MMPSGVRSLAGIALPLRTAMASMPPTENCQARDMIEKKARR